MSPRVARPLVRILVNHRDATGDFSPFLLSASFADHMDGETDTLDLSLEDTDARWHTGWYPVKGTTVEAWLGYEDRPLLACGTFQVDEIEFQGPPDTVTVKAVGNGNRVALRTPRHRGYDGVSLRDVAREVAARHSLQVVGEIPDIRWRRLSQHRETDLAFLQRIASEHGAVFTVKGGQLVFHEIQSLEAGPAILKLDRSDLTDYRFRDKVVEAGADHAYFNPDTKGLETARAGTEGRDQRRLLRRAEGPGHAQRLVSSARNAVQSREREGSLTLPGDSRLVAGAKVELDGFGILNGLWLIQSATHSLDRSSGYKTALEVRHVER